MSLKVVVVYVINVYLQIPVENRVLAIICHIDIMELFSNMGYRRKQTLRVSRTFLVLYRGNSVLALLP